MIAAMGSRLLGGLRLTGYLLWTAVMIPIQAAAIRLGLRSQLDIPRLYHRVCARILGFDLIVRGEISTARPTLFVSNHSSYLDITMLGAVVRGSFVAKSEVAGWPLFGLLARLQSTVFVDRRPGSTGTQRDNLASRLRAGDSLILFAEGTSSDGNRTLPFKSALFAAADPRMIGRPVAVQPVSITCTALDGIPLGRTLRAAYAWYGDMELMSHIWAMAGLGRMTVAIQFHPPVTLEAFGTRKALADHCWRTVAGGVAQANAGRLPALPGRAGSGGGTARRRRMRRRWLRWWGPRRRLAPRRQGTAG